MPVYDYKCKEHGVFNDLATMDDYDKPGSCPQCGELSPRVIMIAPEILAMSPAKRKAHETNERAQHEPAYSTKERREDDEEHAHGCGCTADKGGSNLIYGPNGEKMFPSMRPWMISH